MQNDLLPKLNSQEIALTYVPALIEGISYYPKMEIKQIIAAGKPKASSKMKLFANIIDNSQYIKVKNTIKHPQKFDASKMLTMHSTTAETKIARPPVLNSQVAVSISHAWYYTYFRSILNFI